MVGGRQRGQDFYTGNFVVVPSVGGAEPMLPRSLRFGRDDRWWAGGKEGRISTRGILWLFHRWEGRSQCCRDPSASVGMTDGGRAAKRAGFLHGEFCGCSIGGRGGANVAEIPPLRSG